MKTLQKMNLVRLYRQWRFRRFMRRFKREHGDQLEQAATDLASFNNSATIEEVTKMIADAYSPAIAIAPRIASTASVPVSNT